jgi:hypothetical protein
MTPEFNSGAAHEACAPPHWDVEEWDFRAWSEGDESLTDGEDLQFLLDAELEDEDNNDNESCDGYDSSSEDDESTKEDPTVGSFMCTRLSDEDDDGDDGGTPTMEPIVKTAPPVTMALEMMAATGAVATVMSAHVLRSSAVGS